MQILSGTERVLLGVMVLFLVSDCVIGDQMRVKAVSKSKSDCIYFGNPERTNARHRFVIERPGHYCLTEDLHARIEFADHPAEDTIISIESGGVVLDLQGHTIGRGRFIRNKGGYGITLVDPENYSVGSGYVRDIIIRNGVIQDFDVGVGFYALRWPSKRMDVPVFDAKANVYRFPAGDITLEKIVFNRNKINFEIPVPPVSEK